MMMYTLYREMWFTSSEVPRPSVPLPGMLDYDHFLIQTLNFKKTMVVIL